MSPDAEALENAVMLAYEHGMSREGIVRMVQDALDEVDRVRRDPDSE